MPRKQTVERAKAELRQGKKPTTAAGEFVREEIEHVRQGKHGARSTKQAIAIGLSKARRAGVPLKPPEEGRAPERTRRSAKRDLETGQGSASRARVGATATRHRQGAAQRATRRRLTSRSLAAGKSRRATPTFDRAKTEDCVKT